MLFLKVQKVYGDPLDCRIEIRLKPPPVIGVFGYMGLNIAAQRAIILNPGE
jgi:hypothetical protein